MYYILLRFRVKLGISECRRDFALPAHVIPHCIPGRDCRTFMRGPFSYYQAHFDIARDDWRSASYYVLAKTHAGGGIFFYRPRAE